MAIKTREEILASLQGIMGDDSSDASLAIIEDITDTFNNFENSKGEDWKTKYEENDQMWRNKYRERFFSPTPDVEEEIVVDDVKPKSLKFEDLFKEE